MINKQNKIGIVNRKTNSFRQLEDYLDVLDAKSALEDVKKHGAIPLEKLNKVLKRRESFIKKATTPITR